MLHLLFIVFKTLQKIQIRRCTGHRGKEFVHPCWHVLLSRSPVSSNFPEIQSNRVFSEGFHTQAQLKNHPPLVVSSTSSPPSSFCKSCARSQGRKPISQYYMSKFFLSNEIKNLKPGTGKCASNPTTQKAEPGQCNQNVFNVLLISLIRKNGTNT